MILGGNFGNGANSGSRASNWNNAASNSNGNIGARGCCDDRLWLCVGYGRAGRLLQRWSARTTCFGEYIARFGRAGSRRSKPAAGFLMGKKHRNLIGRVVDEANLRLALQQAARGKRRSVGYLEFKEYEPLNLARLGEEIAAGAYHPAPPHQFVVFEPKRRVISAPTFRDRVAQHALVNVIGPILDAGLLPRAYACREGRGTHAAVIALQADMRRLGAPLYALKTDFSRFFPSIDRATLNRLIAKKITCAATLDLVETITPPDGVGLPIGALTSQIYANVYAGQVDRLLQCDLKRRFWYRYMDDIVVLGRSSERLREVKDRIEAFSLAELGLKFSHWSVAPISRGVNFLGYRIWPTHKLLRRQSVRRARKRLRELQSVGDDEALAMFRAAWLGHAQWADSHHLLKSLGLET